MDSNAEREIVISREIDAPRERVWEAFTDPEQLIQWWGPEGFTNTFNSIDIKEGGVWDFDMHGPDGVDYPNKIVYEELIKPSKISYTHSGLDKEDFVEFQTTFTFEEVDGKTNLTLRLVFATAAEKEKQVKFGAVEGGNSTLKKLADFLAKDR